MQQSLTANINVGENTCLIREYRISATEHLIRLQYDFVFYGPPLLHTRVHVRKQWRIKQWQYSRKVCSQLWAEEIHVYVNAQLTIDVKQ